jgi:hypothetical protein
MHTCITYISILDAKKTVHGYCSSEQNMNNDCAQYS